MKNSGIRASVIVVIIMFGSLDLLAQEDSSAEPVGGYYAFSQYLDDNLIYPDQAKELGIEGNVFVSFVVDTEGNLTELTVVKGIGAGCDEEAVRLLKSAPKWQPARQGGQLVSKKAVMPVKFKLKI